MHGDKRAFEVYLSYSHVDSAIMNKLKNCLQPLERQNLVTFWDDDMISAGSDWKPEIEKHLNAANIILFLVSASSLNSHFIREVEIPIALKRHNSNEARIIPIIIDNCDWQSTPFGKLMALPEGGKPITQWKDRQAAFNSIVEGVRSVAEELSAKIPQSNEINELDNDK